MDEESILSLIETDDTVELLQKLIQTVTTNPPAHELPLVEWVGDYMKKAGFEVEVLPFGDRRGNLLARLPGSGGKPTLIFNAHFDTVPEGDKPWIFDPYSGTVSDGKIYGRGAADMKGGMAAMIKAAEVIAKSKVKLTGDLLIAFTSGETSNCIGAKKLIEENKLKDVDYLLISEPTGLNVYVAEKTAFWVKAITEGATAHTSMPSKGENAINSMVRFLNKVLDFDMKAEAHPLLGLPSLVIGTIHGGKVINVIPDRCEAQLDLRLLPSQDPDTVLKQLEELGGGTVRLEVIDLKKSVESDPNSLFTKTCLKAVEEVTGKPRKAGGVSYFTDGTIIANALNIPMAIIGPAETWMTHQQNEYVEVERLVDGAKIFALIAHRLLK
ncbi:MAG: M20 family metallopeptidase [Candidatus Ranarchaeia archaeon]|jgi:succinyl-diaminopimelate desuccinylase